MSIEASAAGGVDAYIAPVAGLYTYQFGPRGKMPPVKFTWYEGGLMPQKSTYFHPKLATGLTISPLAG